MVQYIKTKKGYFYKLKKKGEKKRISQEEYNKKNKTRKNNKIIGGAEIYDDDIMYKDENVHILHPNVKKGIIVWTKYTQSLGEDKSLCETGLKSGKKLQEDYVKTSKPFT